MRSPGINGEGELRGQPANPGSPGKMAVKTECVCVCVCVLNMSVNYNIYQFGWILILCNMLSFLTPTDVDKDGNELQLGINFTTEIDIWQLYRLLIITYSRT